MRKFAELVLMAIMMLYIHLLGHLRFFLDGQPFKFSSLPKTFPLLAYLLLHSDTPVPRDNLAFLLWGDVPESEAKANLRRHLHHLRRALPPETAEMPWILIEGQTIQWNRSAPYWLDVAEFQRLSRLPEHLVEAITIYTGEFLPNVYDDWLAAEREQLHNLYMTDLNWLIARYQTRGDLRQALVYAQQLLGLDPLREDVIRQLMELRYELGDRPGALQLYQRFEKRLNEELGVSPMPETRHLFDIIAQNQPLPGKSNHQKTALPEVTPSLPVVPRFSLHNLPAQLTTFIGREQEMAAVEQLIGSETAVRLLTITGPGGTGKTRLALEVTHRLQQKRPNLFPDGYWFVSLVLVMDAALVPRAILNVLGVTEKSDQEKPADVLNEYLQSKNLLLVLDSFEHLSGATPIIANLLATAPKVHILITSQANLQLYGEQEFPIQPLPLPDLKQLPQTADLLQFAAIALFVERARAVNPAFVLTPANSWAVAEICACLDGIPLAIELAAAQSKMFQPATMLNLLSSRLKFLINRSKNASLRRQTLRGAIDWSYNLLTESEKRLFACLAIFNGVFALEAVVSVLAPVLEIDEWSLTEQMASLVDKNIVRQVLSNNETAFRLLQTLQEYALERLAALSELDRKLQLSHARYYLRLVDRADLEWRSGEKKGWLEQLKTADDNLRAALIWTLDEKADQNVHETGVQLAVGLGRYWQANGRLTEGRSWLSRALVYCHDMPLKLQVRLLNQTGWLAQLQGDYRLATTYHEKALRLARQLNDLLLIALSLHFLGTTAGRQGEYSQADAFLSECATLQRGLNLPSELAVTLNNQAIVAKYLNDYGRAMALLEESMEIKRTRGDVAGTAASLANLGNLAMLQQDYKRAAILYQESLSLKRESGDLLAIITSLDQMGELALVQGHFVRSARLFGAAEKMRQTLQVPRTPSIQTAVFGFLTSLQQHLAADVFAASWAEGEAMPLEKAVAYALAE